MTRESGHFAFELEFEDWSVAQETVLGEIRCNELSCRFAQFEDGRISFTLSDPNGEVFTIRTQKLQFDKPGAVLLMRIGTRAKSVSTLTTRNFCLPTRLKRRQ